MPKAKIVCGVTGCIAAYKAADLVSALTQADYQVDVIMTNHACQLIGPATLRALSKRPVHTELFADPQSSVPHVSLAEQADLVVIAPVTANTISKLAHGLADDLLTTTVLASSVPKILVPAMNTQMWQNSLVQNNLTILKQHGFIVIPPETGYLACGQIGEGRYPATAKIIETIENTLRRNTRLTGRKIIITGGGTKEPIDAVRVISNLSSGKMGQALAQTARQMGAEVIYIEADTVENLKQNISAHFDSADALIMAAAVSDYRPIKKTDGKIKSTEKILSLELEKTEDLLAYFGQRKKSQYLVGFALESENLEQNAKSKLQKKNLDLIVANSISVLGSDQTSITLIDQEQIIEKFESISKLEAAEQILEKLCRNFGQ